jgi:WD40 repeat protein
VSLWRIDQSAQPLLEEFGRGKWQLAFSASGTRVLLGTPVQGFQLYDTSAGQLIGPVLGSGGSADVDSLLGFSADEQTLITGGPGSTARFWKAPAAKSASESTAADQHAIWPPAGDAVAVATPDASTIVIGDRQGNVHMLAAGGGREAFLAAEESVSFLGHGRKVRMLSVSADGGKIASVADDNSIRIWNTATGLPQPFFGDASGYSVEHVVFSPDASLLGVLSGSRIQIMDTTNGSVVSIFELGESHQSMAFADDNRLYVGSESGTLRVLTRGPDRSWRLQPLWQGDAAIRWLAVSPRARFLVFVDQNNLAQQFILSEGRIGKHSVQLPGRVKEVTFAPSGSRVLIRSSRWIHRASSSVSGLIWLDAMFAPKPVASARMVFGEASNNTATPLGDRVYLPTAGDGFVQISELNFNASRGSALFGNKDKLLDEWRHRIGAD